MKAKDEALWQGLMADFAADESPNSLVLKQFLIEWADMAEQVIEDTKTVEYSDFGDEVINQDSPMRALRKTLFLVESQQPSGFIHTSMIGAALSLLAMHWEHGDSIANDMTQIELHLVQEVTAYKVVQLQEQAKEAGNETSS